MQYHKRKNSLINKIALDQKIMYTSTRKETTTLEVSSNAHMQKETLLFNIATTPQHKAPNESKNTVVPVVPKSQMKKETVLT